MKALRLIFAALGALLILDTAFAATISNGHEGTYIPALLGLPLVVLAIFWRPMTGWFAATAPGGFVKWFVIAAYVLFTLFIGIMSTVLSIAGNRGAAPNADALIVLGCGVRGERVSLTLRYRLDKALEYLESNPDTIVVVSGGQGEGELVTEAAAMRDYLTAHGVDESRIISEERSQSTVENFRFSKALIDEAVGEDAHIAFVTTGYHVFRAQKVAAKLGIEAEGLGASGSWYVIFNDYLRECLVVVLYTLQGKI